MMLLGTFRFFETFQKSFAVYFKLFSSPLQARVAQMVARWFAVPEIRVQTLPGAN